jgi:hypothetical protein
MSRSWSLQAVARSGGLRAPQLARALENAATITPKLAAQVGAAYDLLWDVEPPRSTQAERDLADAAGDAAHLRGWPPPLAWDDEKIDNPDAKPAGRWRPSSRLTMRSSDLAEDADFVRGAGGYRQASVGVVAARLGVSQARLEKALSRQRHSESREAEPEVG